MSPEHIHALRNYYKPLRMLGTKIDALEHVKQSSIKNPGAVTSSNRGLEDCRNADDIEKYTPTGK